jgi:uncharacterized repeat protein (TIGR03803 family)
MKYATLFAFVLALSVSAAYAAGPKFTPAYTFTCNGNPNNRFGACPQGGRPGSLILGSDGNFYGTAQVSMEGISQPWGGVVFSLAPSGTLKVLHTFTAGPNKDYADGNIPEMLAEGPDGKLYGETALGGNDNCNGFCDGLLFRVNRDGTGFTVIHKYCSEANCADGLYGGALVAGTDGNVYGTTQQGGTDASCSGGCGTLFRVTPSTGAYEVVVNFTPTNGGGQPSNLMVASDGTLWGFSVGTTDAVLFHYTESNGTFQSFPMNFPLIQGDLPSAPLMMAFGPNGNFFGLYGIYATDGTGVFEVDTDGSNLQLFPFYTTSASRGVPEAMILASDGNFWVADQSGITGSYGDIITLSPTDGSLIQTLQPFAVNSAEGTYPVTLMQAPNGALWGTTISYGKAAAEHFGDGVIFRLNAGLPAK